MKADNIEDRREEQKEKPTLKRKVFIHLLLILLLGFTFSLRASSSSSSSSSSSPPTQLVSMKKEHHSPKNQPSMLPPHGLLILSPHRSLHIISSSCSSSPFSPCINLPHPRRRRRHRNEVLRSAKKGNLEGEKAEKKTYLPGSLDPRLREERLIGLSGLDG